MHLIPQFGASIYPTPSGEVKLIASKGFRNPTIREMYMFTFQNPDLEPEQLWSYEVSWRERLLNNRLLYEVGGFYINGENMIQMEPYDGRMVFFNTGKVENWGLEFSSSYRTSKMFQLSANYSFLHMRYAVLAAPEHKLYMGVEFTKGRFGASTGIQQIIGLYTSISDESNTQESFTLWNLRVNFHITPSLNIYAKGENLLNQSYEINSGFPMPGATVMCGVRLRL